MIGLSIGAAELAAIEAGACAVVLAPGTMLPHAPPLLPLVLQDGVLARPDARPTATLPLPGGARLLAVYGTPAATAALLARLPPGPREVADLPELLGLLAAELREAAARADAMEADRNRLRRALGPLTAPRPQRVLDLPPDAAATSLPLSQPLGRPAEGLCRVELHLAAPAATELRVALHAAGRVLAAWRVPAEALQPGWLALDLPEPLPPGPEAATLDLRAETAAGMPPLLSLAEGGALALRLWTAPEGWAVLPRHADWPVMGTPFPAQPLPLPAEVLAAAKVRGASAELVSTGPEQPRLLVELPPGATADIALPPVPRGAAELLRARWLRRGDSSSTLDAALHAETAPGAEVATGWRESDPQGRVDLWLPLGPGAMCRATLRLRHTSPAPVLVELAGIALQPGVGREPRWLPPPASTQPPDAPIRIAAPPRATLIPAAFQGVAASLQTIDADQTTQRLDMTVNGLVSAAGAWRQLRAMLCDHAGAIGLELRDAPGWPAVFDHWPGTAQDAEGPVWRLEAADTATALSGLAAENDRALVAALLEVLPGLATAAAAAAGLGAAEQAAWRERARILTEAVSRTGWSA